MSRQPFDDEELTPGERLTRKFGDEMQKAREMKTQALREERLRALDDALVVVEQELVELTVRDGMTAIEIMLDVRRQLANKLRALRARKP